MKNVQRFAAVAAVALAAAGIIWWAVSLTEKPVDSPVRQTVMLPKSTEIGTWYNGPPAFPSADPGNQANREVWGEDWFFLTQNTPYYADVAYAKLERPEGTEIVWQLVFDQNKQLDGDLGQFLTNEAQQPSR